MKYAANDAVVPLYFKCVFCKSALCWSMTAIVCFERALNIYGDPDDSLIWKVPVDRWTWLLTRIKSVIIDRNDVKIEWIKEHE